MNEGLNAWEGVSGSSLLDGSARGDDSPERTAVSGVPVSIDAKYLPPNEGESDTECLERVFTVLDECYDYAAGLPGFEEDVYRAMCSTEVTREEKERLVDAILMGPASDGPENTGVLYRILQAHPLSSATFHEAAPLLDMIAMAKWQWEYEDWIGHRKNPFSNMLQEATDGVEVSYLVRVRSDDIIQGQEERDFADRMYGANLDPAIKYERHVYDKYALPFQLSPGLYAKRDERGGINVCDAEQEPSVLFVADLMQKEHRAHEARAALDAKHNKQVVELARTYCTKILRRDPWDPDYDLIEQVVNRRDMSYRTFEHPDCVAITARAAEIIEVYDTAMRASEEAWWEARRAQEEAIEACVAACGAHDRLDIQERSTQLFSTPLNVADVFPPIVGEDKNARDALFSDYGYLLTPWVRERVESDFEVELAEMELHEQGAFLIFLSQQKESEVDRVREFTKKFGTDGARVLLAGRYSTEEAERVVELGEILPKHEAANLFTRYLGVTERSHVLETQLKRTATDRVQYLETDDVRLHDRAITQLHEAMVRRSKDLLLAAHQLARGQEQGLSLNDVHTAYSSVGLLLDVLHGLQGGGGYEVVSTTNTTQPDHQVTKFLVRDTEAGAEGGQYEYVLKILARPEELRDKAGVLRGEARVNIELGFDTARPNDILKKAFHSRTLRPGENTPTDNYALRLALDRDTHYEGGQVSFDMGRGNQGDWKSLPEEGDAALSVEGFTRRGDVLGKLLQLVGEEGSHNTASFDADLADPEKFKKLVVTLTNGLARFSQASPTYTQTASA